MAKDPKTCPKCGSKNIEHTLVGIIRGLDTNTFVCDDCGTQGRFCDFEERTNKDDGDP